MYYIITYNIGFDAKALVWLLDRLHVAHNNNTKIEMIHNTNDDNCFAGTTSSGSV